MKKSTKAALLSGLLFPGIGHVVLKQYVRGSILMMFSLIALSVIVKVAIERAQTVVDRVSSGEIPLDAKNIANLISSSADGASNQIVNISVIVFGACWLAGIVDSYRLGIIQDK